jgi:hypothetical protein
MEIKNENDVGKTGGAAKIHESADKEIWSELSKYEAFAVLQITVMVFRYNGWIRKDSNGDGVRNFESGKIFRQTDPKMPI